jgi:hypothetical protein
VNLKGILGYINVTISGRLNYFCGEIKALMAFFLLSVE